MAELNNQRGRWLLSCTLPGCEFTYDARQEALQVLFVASPFDSGEAVTNRVLSKAAPALETHLREEHPDSEGSA